MRVLVLLLALATLSCVGPIVEDRVHEVDPPTLRLIAVAPFLPAKEFHGDVRDPQTTGVEAAEAAALTTRFVTEAFAAKGFEVIPASDLVHAFQAKGKPVPHGDTAVFARVAAEEFGATALLTGKVYRYQSRQGGELGATRPASVGYQLMLYAAPGERLLWEARFDHKQVAVSENLFVARRYPGAGSRWLSAAELVRWGAASAANRLLELK